MSNKGKNLKELRSKVDRDKLYTLDEAVNLLNEIKAAKFDESIDMAIRLGIDPRKSDCRG